MTTCSDLTQYPKLYSRTYWGKERAPLISDHWYASYLEIIENRNRFIREYDIKKDLNGNKRPGYLSDYIFNLSNGPTSDLFDHIEAYGTNDGSIIIITSPYGENHSQHENFNLIYNMYAEDATTYMQNISKSAIMNINKHQRRIAARKFSYITNV